MHLTLLIWRGEAGQRPGIWQRKSAHDGEFWLPPSPGGGDFWISSDYGRHLGLEAVKYMVTRRLSVVLHGGLVTKDGGHCSRKDLRVFFVRMCKENVTSYLYLSSVFSFKWIYPFIYVIFSRNQPGGTPHIKGMGMLVGNFESNP